MARELPRNIKEQITNLLKEMERAEGKQLGEQGPVFLESMEPLWYVAYKTEASVME